LMPRWMPSQASPLNRNSICLAAAADDSSRAPTSARRKAGRLSSRSSFFRSWVWISTTRSPRAARSQRLRKNSTSASSGIRLVDSDLALDGIEKELRVVADAVLENGFSLADVGDILRRIARDDHEVGGQAGRDAARRAIDAQEFRAVGSGDLQRLERRQAGLHQQLDRAPAAVPGEAPAVAGRVRPHHEAAAGAEKLP